LKPNMAYKPYLASIMLPLSTSNPLMILKYHNIFI